MPANPPYFPTKNTEQADWAINFSDLITAAPATYGLTAPDAVLIDAAKDTYVAALAVATAPATRTSVTVAAKDAALASLRALLFPYATNISQNSAVTAGAKTAVGVTNRSNVRTRNALGAFIISLDALYGGGGLIYIDARETTTPGTKKRPIGALGFQLQVRLVAAPNTIVFDAVLTKPANPIDLPIVAQSPQGSYEMRGRWIGASLNGGTENASAWSAWVPIIL